MQTITFCNYRDRNLTRTTFAERLFIKQRPKRFGKADLPRTVFPNQEQRLSLQLDRCYRLLMPVTRANRENESVHIAEAIQPHGALIACDGFTHQVVQVSENTRPFFETEPQSILGRPIADLFAPSSAGMMTELLAAAAAEEGIMRRVTSRSSVELECVAHRASGVIIIEAQRAQDNSDAELECRSLRALIQLACDEDTVALTEHAVHAIRELTRFDRVQVYLFDASSEGQLVAESKHEDLQPFLEQQGPASGVRAPSAASLTLIADVSQRPAALVPVTVNDKPLDLRRAHLRCVSASRIEHLTRLGISASLSLALLSEGKRIGLISCHHYAGPRVLSHQIRETVEQIGRGLSRNLIARERAELATQRIATLRAMNKRLSDADKAKDLFIATISHELRNPLAAISGWARLYLDGVLPNERREDAVRIISRNASVLGNLVDDLLDVSRIVSGSISLELEHVDLPSLIESVVSSTSVAADAKGVRVVSALGHCTGPILGDSGRLRQVVSNLCSNAIKFTPQGGVVTLALARSESELEFSVQDTGIGLDPTALGRVFDTFWQADSSTVRKEKGLGLGLAIAKRLVELHGGSITAESAGLGRGTTFRVRLPVTSARLAQSTGSTPPPPAGVPAERPLANVRALVVEDEEDSRELIRQILEHAGATVDCVANASRALQVLSAESSRTKAFDVLVSDIGMPEMDGFELIAALRRHTSAKVTKIPSVALTAYTRATDRTAALRAGFQAHVPKPADPEELVAVIVSVVRRL